MRYRNSLLFVSFLLILILCWIDYQYLSEGYNAFEMSEGKRRVAHMIILAALVPVGYMGWYKHPMQWIKKLWLVSYLLAIVLILIIGLLQWQFNIFGTTFLDAVMSFRTFFCSPLPFFILYVLSVVVKNISPAS